MLLALPTFSPGDLVDPTVLLQGAGPWVLAVIVVIVFIETGLMFPFLPGDSLLFTAGLLSVPLGLPLFVLIPVAGVTAIAGDQVGYMIGEHLGSRLFKPDARVFKTAYRDRADAFLARYGARSLVLARFVPIVRTFIPPLVGTTSLPYPTFLLWNAVGGIAWATVLSLAGFWLGKIPLIADNVDLIAVVIVVVSVVPVGIDLLRRRAGERPRRGDVNAPEAGPAD